MIKTRKQNHKKNWIIEIKASGPISRRGEPNTSNHHSKKTDQLAGKGDISSHRSIIRDEKRAQPTRQQGLKIPPIHITLFNSLRKLFDNLEEFRANGIESIRGSKRRRSYGFPHLPKKRQCGALGATTVCMHFCCLCFRFFYVSSSSRRSSMRDFLSVWRFYFFLVQK